MGEEYGWQIGASRIVRFAYSSSRHRRFRCLQPRQPADTSDPRPFVNMSRAVTRARPGGHALSPGQAITVRDVIDAYTIMRKISEAPMCSRPGSWANGFT